MIVLNERWGELIRETPSDTRSLGSGQALGLPQAYVIHTETGQIRRHLLLSSSLQGPTTSPWKSWTTETTRGSP
jgi:hypothetical protein